MQVMVWGATGALGRRLVPMLAERGHEVIGTTTAEAKRRVIEDLGAKAVVADGLDPEAVGRAVSEAEPEVLVHQMTSLSGDLNFRKMDEAFELTNRLRSEATDNLISAGRAAGVRRIVAQSFAGMPLDPAAGRVLDEDAPFDPDPPRRLEPQIAAIRRLEESVLGAEGMDGFVLRYGGFYGPGTSIQTDPDGDQVAMVRKRVLPIIGDGGGILSLVHVDDAAAATVAAIEAGASAAGVYNIVDDVAAPARVFLPELAAAVGAKPPRRIPRWLARLVAGEAAVSLMTKRSGATNGKARRELGWEPRYGSWRVGFAEGLSAAADLGPVSARHRLAAPSL